MLRIRRCLRAASIVVVVLAANAAAPGQRLALRTYTTRDGLAHSRVNCVHQDRRGYLWFGTWEGLSRFDGSRFVNFGLRDGLPNAFINCIAEDADGALWVGTLGDGIARLRRTRRDDGVAFDSWSVSGEQRGDDVYWLDFDASGSLWLATALGLYQGTFAGDELRLGRRADFSSPDAVGSRQPDGSLWCFGSGTASLLRDGTARTQPHGAQGSAGTIAGALWTAPRMLLAHEHALLQNADPSDDLGWRAVQLPLRDGERITSLAAELDGALWVGTSLGLLGNTGSGWHRYGLAQGLPDDWIRSLYTDRDQNLWIATHRGGLARLADLAAVSYGVGEGFADPNVARVVEGSDGRIYATSDVSGVYEVFDDHVAHVPGGEDPAFAHVHMRFACDHNGDFWLGSDRGIWFCRGPSLDLAHCRPIGPDEGVAPSAVCAAISETDDGSIWFGSLDLAVHRLDPGSRRWQLFTSLDKVGDASACRVVADDGQGGMFLGSFDRLWRWVDGRCEPVLLAATQPLRPRSLLRDRRGWNWIGTRFQGAFVDRGPSAGGYLHLDSRVGLASDAVWSIAEDQAGRIYLGTAHGISRFDATSQRLQPFGGGGRLAGEVVNHLLCDRRGRLWAATSSGLTRFDLDDRERAHAPPSVYLAAIKVDGKVVAMEQNGVEKFAGLQLTPSQRSLEVEFVGLRFHDERPVRYQHRLASVDADWSPPTTADMVQFADLPAGEHLLVVRALDADEGVSPRTAELSFTVAPPFWRTAWFVALVATCLAGFGWLWHRTRLRSAVATERLRTQIASDLHDEVGAGLAQIAILSEVARQRAAPEVAVDLGEVAGLARSLREAMGDIVWALARGNHTLADLVHRLRHLCSRMLEVEGTVVQFDAPDAPSLAALPLSLEQRRQLWLWCREALTNVARHADARTVTVQLELPGRRLRLRIADDGIGFHAGLATTGNGLLNLRRRCERLGGHLHLTTAPGRGTELVLDVPLRAGAVPT